MKELLDSLSHKVEYDYNLQINIFLKRKQEMQNNTIN